MDVFGVDAETARKRSWMLSERSRRSTGRSFRISYLDKEAGLIHIMRERNNSLKE